MSLSKVKGQKSGNNTLFFIAGFLSVVLLILIFLSKTSESSVDELIQSAAPDSSAFASQELVSPQELEEPDEKEAEEKKVEIIPLADSAVKTVSEEATPSDSIKASIPVDKPKIEESGDGKIYFYKIKKGDTMYKIAAKFGNKPADVMAQNGLTDMALQADKEIKVKIKGLHRVSAGEGLKAISEKYNVPSKSILIANSLSSESLPAEIQLIIPLK